MDISQVINDIETFTPYSIIQESVLDCKRQNKGIEEYAGYICFSLIKLMKSNKLSVKVKRKNLCLEIYKEELLFEKESI